MPVRFAKVDVRPVVVAASLRLRLTLANGRRAELEIEDLGPLDEVVEADVVLRLDAVVRDLRVLALQHR